MIIIDGYNLLFAQKGEIPDLESARAGLIELLQKYNSKKGNAVKIVFDVKANPFLYNSKTKTNKGKVEVIFSPSGTTADDYIIKLVGGFENKKTIRVVSSDKKVASAVKTLGAQAVSSVEFFKEITSLLKSGKNDDYYYEKEHGIPKAEVHHWMKVFGLDKNKK